MPKPTPKPDSVPITELKSKREALVTARDQIRLQLNGVENQIYILNQLINPQPKPEPAPESEPIPAPEPTPPAGTI